MTDAKFDINSADKDKLMKTLRISDEVAQKIIEHQTKSDSTKEFWDVVDQQFKDITQAGKSAFVLNKNINLIVVIIGIIIIGSSLAYTWVKGVDPWSTLLSGIGIGSFVIVFFNNPQSNINKAVAALASVSIIYKGHKVEYEAIASAIT
jgi:hypothetical protein